MSPVNPPTAQFSWGVEVLSHTHLFPLEKHHIIADAPPLFWVGAPALTASAAAVLDPNLRDSVAPFTIVGHPVFPAFANTLRPSIKMVASALEARFPVSMGAPALTAPMADFFWAPLPPNLRNSAAPSTITGHPVFSAFAAALRPSRKMVASALKARFPVSMGAPTLKASMADFSWVSLLLLVWQPDVLLHPRDCLCAR